MAKKEPEYEDLVCRGCGHTEPYEKAKKRWFWWECPRCGKNYPKLKEVA